MTARLIAALVCAASLVLCVPAHAQELFVPLTGQRVRPIEARSLFHTLFTDFFSENDGTTYVQTGDIPAMWLRDSAAQTIPYVRFVPFAPILAVRFNGVIQRDARNVIVDPYANAFRASYRVWEEKWEVDSPAWPVLLAWTYRRITRRRDLFTPQLHAAFSKIVATYDCEQRHDRCSRYRSPYGNDRPSRSNTGFLWGAFRPSDDPVAYPFNIPQQAIAAVALADIARLSIEGYGDRALALRAQSISSSVHAAIERYGRVYSPRRHAWIYAFETDALGHALLADDANVPNLTALPYIGWCNRLDTTYLSTRTFALSNANRWFYRGRYASGIGSEHTPDGYVWPLGIIARALTAGSAQETAEAITTLAETDSADGLIHESFYPNGYWRYTRAEFGWANAMYAELLFRSICGLSEPSFAPSGTLAAFEQPLPTPRLVRAVAQLDNDARILGALFEMLAEADGRTTIVAGRPTPSANRRGR